MTPAAALAAIAALAILANGGLMAQAGAGRQPRRVFRAVTRLVQVPVTAQDAKGHFVAGLTASDFRLWVNGKRTPIAALDVMRATRTTVLPARPAEGWISNQPEMGARNRVVFLFDYLHMPRAVLPRLRQQLMALLSHPLPAGVDVAMFNLGGGLQMEQPFTRNRTLLGAAVRRIEGLPGRMSTTRSMASEVRYQPMISGPHYSSGSMSGHGPAAAEAMIEAHIRTLQGQMGNTILGRQYYDTMNGLQMLAQLLAGVPGHKEVLWFTTSTSFAAVGDRELALNGRQMQQALRQMNAANAAIFPINPAGLEAFNGRRGMNRDATVSQMVEDVDADHAAQKTGGKAMAENNALTALAQTAMSWPRDQYVLYFSPPGKRGRKPRYEKIRVKLLRHGAHIYYRRGYEQAGRDFRGGRKAKLHMARLALSPMDWSGLPLAIEPGGLTAAMAPYWRGAPAGERIQELPFTLAIPARRILHRRPGGGYEYDFSVATLMMANGGGGVSRMPIVDHYRRKLTAAEGAAMLAKMDGSTATIRYQGRFVIPAGTNYFGRAVVRDNIDGKVGTVTIEF